MRTAIVIAILVLSVINANAQSGVGLSIKRYQTRVEKCKLLNDSSFISCNVITNKYLEPWKKLQYGQNSIKSDTDWWYSSDPRIMIDYAINARKNAPGSNFNIIEYDRFKYPVTEYEGLGTMIIGLLINSKYE